MLSMRSALAALAVLGAPLAAAAMTSPPGMRTVTCDESIATTRFPYLGNGDKRYRYRLVLGAASVPPAIYSKSSPPRSAPGPTGGKPDSSSVPAQSRSPSPCRSNGAPAPRSPGQTAATASFQRLRLEPRLRERLRWRLLPHFTLGMPAARLPRRHVHHHRSIRHRAAMPLTRSTDSPLAPTGGTRTVRIPSSGG